MCSSFKSQHKHQEMAIMPNFRRTSATDSNVQLHTCDTFLGSCVTKIVAPRSPDLQSIDSQTFEAHNYDHMLQDVE